MYEISKREYFDVWIKAAKCERNVKLFKYLVTKFNLPEMPEPYVKKLKKIISLFSSKILQKWNASCRRADLFLEKNHQWLNSQNFVFQLNIDLENQDPCYIPVPSTSRSSGRPQIEFDNASVKTKKRRVQDLVKSRSVNELTFAAEVSLRATGQKGAAAILRDVTNLAPIPKEIKKLRLDDSLRRPLSGDEALAYYVDSKSTTLAYKTTRKWTMKAGHCVFPSYYVLKMSKKACLPEEKYVLATETGLEIKLQAILDLTAQRIAMVQKNTSANSFGTNELRLISKWGCDGSSGHSRYKQKFSDQNSNDEFLFLFSFVPIKLHKADDANACIWQNPKPSSTMYCRPIKFFFMKENDAMTKLETQKVLDEIKNLQPSKILIEDREFLVTHKLLLTMVDGKVCNALTETKSTQSCYICKATPRLMNQRNPSFVDNEENYGFGISTLHAWIRSFECFLHISYRLNIRKWRVDGDRDKEDVKKRKSEIQARFKQEMGLIVDMPKPSFGSTNDGNTARRFFQNADLSANITGLDVTLIKRVYVLLQTLSSGLDINITKFQIFAEQTRQLYLDLYCWYNMPVTLHKILVHSTNIIKNSLVPIGQLSEEAQEARNKDCRRFREHHTQKSSRVSTNKDLANMLLITSDPVINSLRDIPQKHALPLSPEALDLILKPDISSFPPSINNELININNKSNENSTLSSSDYETVEEDSSDD